MGETLLIRADASAEVGMGHVMRCLALAQAWQDAGGRAVFAMVEPGQKVRARLEGEGVEVVEVRGEPGGERDVEDTRSAVSSVGARFVVIDGYRFATEYTQAVLEAGARTLQIDDNGEVGRYVSHLVLNQNLHANEALYRDRLPRTRLLLGSRFALLRREFRQRGPGVRVVPDQARKILVTLGGSDPANVTPRVLESLEVLAQEPGAEFVVRVIVGSANPFEGDVRARAKRVGMPVEVLVNVDDMPAQMEWADVAISAAGSTCWEMAFMRLPALVVVTAENQRELARRLSETGVVVSLGEARDIVASSLVTAIRSVCSRRDARCRMADTGGEIVDGAGAPRVVQELEGE